MSNDEQLTIEVTNQNVGGQYECQGDKGIDEKLHEIVLVNVYGMNNEFMKFALH